MLTTSILSGLSTHPILKKGFKKLNKEEVTILTSILDSEMNKAEATNYANKLSINSKTKNWLVLSEMVSCALTVKFGV